jgi:hypothetical protein
MPVLPQQEQAIDTWLTSHSLQIECPECGSRDRRIDRNPPASVSKWQQGERFKTATTTPVRFEITCLNCTSVRVFDAAKMGL